MLKAGNPEHRVASTFVRLGSEAPDFVDLIHWLMHIVIHRVIHRS